MRTALLRAGLAVVLALLLAATGYSLLLAVGSVVGAWSAEVRGEQARALLLHFSVVALRGILPATLLAAGLALALEARSALGPRLAAVLAATVAAAVVVPSVLTSGLGGLPRLAIQGGANQASSVLALGALAALAWLAAGRLLRRRRA